MGWYTTGIPGALHSFSLIDWSGDRALELVCSAIIFHCSSTFPRPLRNGIWFLDSAAIEAMPPVTLQILGSNFAAGSSLRQLLHSMLGSAIHVILKSCGKCCMPSACMSTLQSQLNKAQSYCVYICVAGTRVPGCSL